MLAHLADVSIRSLLVALSAAIVLWILRSRRTAALQHAVWAAVVCGMLALFAFGQTLPRLPLRVLYSASAPAPLQHGFADRLTADEYPATAALRPPTPAPPGPRRPIEWKGIVLLTYCAIALAFLTQFVTGILLVRKLAATGHRIAHAGTNDVYESDRVSVPVTVLWLRPRILLPPEWRQWEGEKLDAVLAHEGAHVWRRDAFVAALAGVNRSLFWFHPLSWMLERKLALLADQACDESCVAVLGDPARYAGLLLEMARVVDRSRGRLRRHALTMAAGSHIRQRIDAILQEGRTFSRGLSGTAWVILALLGIPVILGAGAVELAGQSPFLGREMQRAIQLDMPKWGAPPPPAYEMLPRRRRSADEPVVQVAQLQAAPQTAPAQSTLPPAAAPKFDRAVIKPCASGDGAGHAGRGGGKGRGIPVSPPGQLYVNCMSIWELVNHYVQQGTAPLLNNSRWAPTDAQRIRGGPAWIYSDLYTIDAETEDPVARGPNAAQTPAHKLLNGPMLQSLIEDRFHLKTHREIEQIPMYALTVSGGGFKLQPMEAGGCVPDAPGAHFAAPGEEPVCTLHVGWEGLDWTIDGVGQSLARLAGALGGAIVDRPVLDKTGIAGLYIFHLRFAHDQNTPGVLALPAGMNPFQAATSDVLPGPSLSALLEQLGLNLVPDQGPREYLVIDSAERPSEN